MFLGVRRATQPAVDFRGQLGATLGADVRPRRPVSRDLAAWRQMVAPQISLRRKGEARVARRVPGSQFEEGPRAHDRTVRRIEKRGALETAHRALGNCGQVFRCAIATGRAYNRTAHLVERRKMMQAGADYQDKLKNGADVIPILKAS